MSYYEPLTKFLADRRLGEIMLTFRQLEGILGRSLPPSARKHQAWWANTTSHSHAEAWLRLDWKTSKVDLTGERVTFARTGPFAADAEPRSDESSLKAASVAVGMDQFSVAGRRLINDYAAEMDGDFAAAVARAVHEAAVARRGRLIDRAIANAPRVPPGEPDSATLIREDRDAR